MAVNNEDTINYIDIVASDEVSCRLKDIIDVITPTIALSESKASYLYIFITYKYKGFHISLYSDFKNNHAYNVLFNPMNTNYLYLLNRDDLNYGKPIKSK